MKQVLLIDTTSVFREYLKAKLEAEQVQVEMATSKRDAFIKLITMLPDLVIMELESGSMSEMQLDLLRKKVRDPNARKIPIVATGPTLARTKIATLAEFGIVKYFNRPIKFTVFFASIATILKTRFSVDETPCMVDMHINGNIIFIEIAQGLNRDKIAMLKYKLPEVIVSNSLTSPKLILMLSDMHLTFIDGANLELLLNNVCVGSGITMRNIKVLTTDQFVKDLIAGHGQYAGMEVGSKLMDVAGGLVENRPFASLTEIATDRILNSDAFADYGSVEVRFGNDSESESDESNGIILKVAIVDEDVIVRKLLQNAFSAISAECVLFESGNEFVTSVIEKKTYDFVVLDLYISDMDGFSILRTLQRHNFEAPVLIYSQAVQRDAVIQALSLGAKSFLVKPQHPTVIVRKAVELLHAED